MRLAPGEIWVGKYSEHGLVRTWRIMEHLEGGSGIYGHTTLNAPDLVWTEVEVP